MKTIKSISILNVLLITLFALISSGCLQQQQENLSQNPTGDSGTTDGGTSIYGKAQMTYHRSGHTSTLLDDGRVLVTGGEPYPIPTTEHSEIYDPDTNTWSLGPTPVVDRRVYASAVKLNDGRVLIVGGSRKDNGVVHPTEVLEIETYDPSTNQFDVVATSTHSLNGATATLLHDGKVLIMGGVDYIGTTQFTYYRTSEIFDPSTNQLRPTAHQPTYPRAGHSAVILTTGDVAMIGGNAYGQELDSVEVYVPGTESYVITSSLAQKMYDQSSFLLPNGYIFNVGGVINPSGIATPLTTAELFNGYSPDVSITLPHGMYAVGTAQLPDGTPVLVGGDSVTNGHGGKDIHIYDISSQAFTKVGELSELRGKSQVTVLNDGSLLVTGGLVMTNDPNDYQSERINIGSMILP